MDYKVKFLDVDGKRVKCQVWDTAGQERFHVITRGARAVRAPCTRRARAVRGVAS